MSTMYSISSDTLTGLADAVRELTGESGTLSPADMINGIEGHVCPSPTIQSLSVTQNGEYTAPSGVDGYSPVSVSVPGIVPSGSQTVTENGTYDVTSLAEMVINVSGGGGASNVVTGTFVGGEATVNVPYTGTGYPVTTVIEVDGGMYKSGTTWYKLIQRYAIGLYVASKADWSTAPDYAGSGTKNKATVMFTVKNSTTSSELYNRGGDVNFSTYDNVKERPLPSAALCFLWRNATTFQTATNGTSSGQNGFASGITYRYWVIYSE